MEIADSARKHAVADVDIRHAMAVPIREVEQEDDRILIIGADRAGRLLELVVLDPEGRGGEPTVIHAMPLRRKFYRFL